MLNHNFDNAFVNEIAHVKVEAIEAIYSTVLDVNFVQTLGGVEVCDEINKDIKNQYNIVSFDENAQYKLFAKMVIKLSKFSIDCFYLFILFHCCEKRWIFPSIEINFWFDSYAIKKQERFFRYLSTFE